MIGVVSPILYPTTSPRRGASMASNCSRTRYASSSSPGISSAGRMSIGWRARKIATMRSAICRESRAGINSLPWTARYYRPTLADGERPAYTARHGRDRRTAEGIYRHPRALGGADHVRHRVRRIVCFFEPVVSGDDAVDRRRHADVGWHIALCAGARRRGNWRDAWRLGFVLDRPPLWRRHRQAVAVLAPAGAVAER